MIKNKWIKRTDLFISTKDLQQQDKEGNVFFHKQNQYLSLTLNNYLRVAFFSKGINGETINNPDFIVLTEQDMKGVIVRIKNKEQFPVYNIQESVQEFVDFNRVITLLKDQFNAKETDYFAKEYVSDALTDLGLSV